MHFLVFDPIVSKMSVLQPQNCSCPWNPSINHVVVLATNYEVFKKNELIDYKTSEEDPYEISSK